ncbi:hypothetical protein AMST5_01439 [freshwater sediment metagenome]|uniref:Gene transfer agent family protein n=1 Tax=freshwater sediment metagenome TaxID=556182 RepID=A0AA48RCQ7_9ZZZZ
MSTTHREFFGDAERDFRLTPKLIGELERLTDAGIGALCKRLFAGDFSHKDICETVRLGLIGGGEDPQSAANLVAVYASDAPLARVYPTAVSILEAAWFGVDEETEEAAE